MKTDSKSCPVRLLARVRVAGLAGLLLGLFLGQAAPSAPPPSSPSSPSGPGPKGKSVRTGGAYLPVLGPKPLRIQAPKAPARAAVLPPLAMDDPKPAAEAPEAATPDAAGAAAVPGAGPALSAEEGPAVTVPLPPGSPGSLMAGAGAADQAPQPIFTPQMLVQFFKPYGSNLVGGAWNVPVFQPPSAGPSKSSSATYRSP